MGTAVDRASAVTEIRQKAEGYGIPNERVDGMNVIAVMEAAEKALKRVRAGEGPYFLEIMTYRFQGHSMGDPERYRTPEEIKKYQESDPIGIYHKWLVDNKKATEKDIETLNAKAEAEVQAAIQFAEESPNPPAEALFENIYVEEN
jgi:pyruvate dehydrogenase E1 component alpha subunit